jgi:hypothetical protein
MEEIFFHGANLKKKIQFISLQANKHFEDGTPKRELGQNWGRAEAFD